MRRRQRLATALLTGPATLAGYGAIAGLFTHPAPWWAYPLWAGSAILSALLASTYLLTVVAKTGDVTASATAP